VHMDGGWSQFRTIPAGFKIHPHPAIPSFNGRKSNSGRRAFDSAYTLPAPLLTFASPPSPPTFHKHPCTNFPPLDAASSPISRANAMKYQIYVCKCYACHPTCRTLHRVGTAAIDGRTALPPFLASWRDGVQLVKISTYVLYSSYQDLLGMLLQGDNANNTDGF